MKIDADTKVNCDTTLLRTSEPVLKRRIGITDTGESEIYESLQIKIDNIAGRPLTHINVQIRYFDAYGKFLGMEDDFYGGILEPAGSWVASTVVDFPKGAAEVTIEIDARAYTFEDRFPWARTIAWALIVLLAVIFIRR